MRDVLIFAVGLVVLTVAADRFVLGAARLSLALRISPVIVGALVIGFGTSAPELLVSVLAGFQEAADLGFGNLVGSNTANALLVLGAAALLSPISVASVTLKREVPLMLAGVALFAGVTADGGVGATEGVLLLAAGAAAIGFVVWVGVNDRRAAEALEADLPALPKGARGAVWRAGALALGGLVGTVAGAQAVVTGASGIARAFGLSEAVVGLTIVAIGTSLPELVAAIAAGRRNEPELVVGNVLGSNLFNSLPVAGIAASLGGVQLDDAFLVGTVVMVGACLLAAALLASGRRVTRAEGGVLLACFAGVTVLTGVS